MKRITTPAVICLLAAFIMLVGGHRQMRPVAAAVEGFDVCIEDDETKGTSLKINSTTGEYVFCAAGKSFTGKGTVVKSASLVILEHLAGDRKLTARIDNGAKNGIASFQSPAGKTLGTIRDANTADSKCECR